MASTTQARLAGGTAPSRGRFVNSGNGPTLQPIDIGHAELKRGEPNESAVDLIRDYGRVLLHLHVHDVREGADHVPLGSGSIHYSTIAAALREVDFEGTAALEIQSDDPVATAEASLAYLRQCFGSDLTR